MMGAEVSPEDLTEFARDDGPSALDMIREDVRKVMDYRKNAAVTIFLAGAFLGAITVLARA